MGVWLGVLGRVNTIGDTGRILGGVKLIHMEPTRRWCISCGNKENCYEILIGYDLGKTCSVSLCEKCRGGLVEIIDRSLLPEYKDMKHRFDTWEGGNQ